MLPHRDGMLSGKRVMYHWGIQIEAMLPFGNLAWKSAELMSPAGASMAILSLLTRSDMNCSAWAFSGLLSTRLPSAS